MHTKLTKANVDSTLQILKHSTNFLSLCGCNVGSDNVAQSLLILWFILVNLLLYRVQNTKVKVQDTQIRKISRPNSFGNDE